MLKCSWFASCFFEVTVFKIAADDFYHFLNPNKLEAADVILWHLISTVLFFFKLYCQLPPLNLMWVYVKHGNFMNSVFPLEISNPYLWHNLKLHTFPANKSSLTSIEFSLPIAPNVKCIGVINVCSKIDCRRLNKAVWVWERFWKMQPK